MRINDLRRQTMTMGRASRTSESAARSLEKLMSSLQALTDTAMASRALAEADRLTSRSSSMLRTMQRIAQSQHMASAHVQSLATRCAEVSAQRIAVTAPIVRSMERFQQQFQGWHARLVECHSLAFADTAIEQMRMADALARPVQEIARELRWNDLLHEDQDLSVLARRIRGFEPLRQRKPESVTEVLDEAWGNVDASLEVEPWSSAQKSWILSRAIGLVDHPSAFIAALLLYPFYAFSNKVEADRLPELTLHYLDMIARDPKLFWLSLWLWSRLSVNAPFLQDLLKP